MEDKILLYVCFRHLLNYKFHSYLTLYETGEGNFLIFFRSFPKLLFKRQISLVYIYLSTLCLILEMKKCV